MVTDPEFGMDDFDPAKWPEDEMYSREMCIASLHASLRAGVQPKHFPLASLVGLFLEASRTTERAIEDVQRVLRTLEAIRTDESSIEATSVSAAELGSVRTLPTPAPSTASADAGVTSADDERDPRDPGLLRQYR